MRSESWNFFVFHRYSWGLSPGKGPLLALILLNLVIIVVLTCSKGEIASKGGEVLFMCHCETKKNSEYSERKSQMFKNLRVHLLCVSVLKICTVNFTWNKY